jgi:hypothetical protein
MGFKAGLNYSSRGLVKTAHRGPASGSRRAGRRRVDFNGNRALRGHQEGYNEPFDTIFILNEHLILREEFAIGSWAQSYAYPA